MKSFKLGLAAAVLAALGLTGSVAGARQDGAHGHHGGKGGNSAGHRQDGVHGHHGGKGGNSADHRQDGKHGHHKGGNSAGHVDGQDSGDDGTESGG